MYLVAIAWIYVAALMALTEPNVTAGILTFSLYGLLPLGLLLWLLGLPGRARRSGQAEPFDQVVGDDNGRDAGADQ